MSGEALFGLCGKDFVIMVADQHASQSICRLSDSEDKIHEVEGIMMGTTGPAADTSNFMEFISKNLRLQTLRTGLPSSVKSAQNFTRNELATALRKGPYQVDMIIGGVDDDGPSMYFLDYLASSEKMNKAAHGYGAYFALSIMDRYYKPDLTIEEAKEIMRKCVQEMKTRFVMHLGEFNCKICTKDGIRVEKL